jgi:hypothetical protein
VPGATPRRVAFVNPLSSLTFPIARNHLHELAHFLKDPASVYSATALTETPPLDIQAIGSEQ